MHAYYLLSERAAALQNIQHNKNVDSLTTPHYQISLHWRANKYYSYGLGCMSTIIYRL